MISDEDDFGGVGELAGGQAPTDTDGDGIPDDVETQLGTDPSVADSTELADSGYSWLEEWANSVVSLQSSNSTA